MWGSRVFIDGGEFNFITFAVQMVKNVLVLIWAS